VQVRRPDRLLTCTVATVRSLVGPCWAVPD